jgi:hypothetical protein
MQTSCVRHDYRERHRYLLAYVLVSMGVIIAFLLAAFAIGCFHWSAAPAPPRTERRRVT